MSFIPPKQSQIYRESLIRHHSSRFSFPSLRQTCTHKYGRLATFSGWLFSFQLLLFKAKRKQFPAAHPLSLSVMLLNQTKPWFCNYTNKQPKICLSGKQSWHDDSGIIMVLWMFWLFIFESSRLETFLFTSDFYTFTFIKNQIASKYMITIVCKSLNSVIHVMTFFLS